MSDRNVGYADVPTILVADDDESNRTLLRDLLEVEGYRVVTANDGESALRLGCEGGIDLALLDVRMPDLNGFAVCQALKLDLRTSLPVVLISGLVRMEDRLVGLDVGADDFIARPFLRGDLIARIRWLIAKDASRAAVLGRRPVQQAAQNETGYAAGPLAVACGSF